MSDYNRQVISCEASDGRPVLKRDDRRVTDQLIREAELLGHLKGAKTEEELFQAIDAYGREMELYTITDDGEIEEASIEPSSFTGLGSPDYQTMHSFGFVVEPPPVERMSKMEQRRARKKETFSRLEQLRADAESIRKSLTAEEAQHNRDYLCVLSALKIEEIRLNTQGSDQPLARKVHARKMLRATSPKPPAMRRASSSMDLFAMTDEEIVRGGAGDVAGDALDVPDSYADDSSFVSLAQCALLAVEAVADPSRCSFGEFRFSELPKEPVAVEEFDLAEDELYEEGEF